MPQPTPQYSLDDSCSCMFNNTLFTYSSEAFQSLPLVEGAAWTELPMGIPVQGGACVKSTPLNDTSAAALYIVGGMANSSDYQGLQRYTFANGQWETIKPSAPVTQNRLYHDAVYLNQSDSILMYAGTQDGSMQPSSQTFTIQASEPYTVSAFQSIAPPATMPVLIPFTESKACYVGGSDENTKVMVFSPSTSWVDSNATLAEPLYSTSNVKAVVINGDDSSKTLYTFDMTKSPNEVNRTILIDGNGNPVQNSPAITSRGLISGQLEQRLAKSANVAKRGNLTVADWPAYNGTLASTTTRKSCSIARDQSGLVVISGGSEDDDVLCMFEARDNCWLNATDQLTSKSRVQQGLGSAPSSTAPAASSSATSPSTGSSHDPAFPVKILGIVLGAIIGVALILVGILFLCRWRRKRRQYTDAGHQRRSSGIPNEKEQGDFLDRGMSSNRQFQGHEPQESQGSFSSMAILMRGMSHKRGGDKGNGSTGSDSSSQFNKKYKTAISNPIPQRTSNGRGAVESSREEKGISFADENKAVTRPRGSRGARRGSTRRSSGWNRYWSGGSAMSILGFGSKRTTYEESETSSHYSDQRLPSQITQNSATVPPLKLGGQPELNRVVSGSPRFAPQADRPPLSREMTGTIHRPESASSTSSFDDNDRRDAFSSGVPASVHEQSSWTPVDRQDWGPGGRAPSNAYSESNYATTVGRNSNFPRESNFPRPPNNPRAPAAPVTSDMSWLNLGGESRI